LLQRKITSSVSCIFASLSQKLTIIRIEGGLVKEKLEAYTIEEIKSEFVKEIEKNRRQGKFVKIKNFRHEFNLP